MAVYVLLTAFLARMTSVRPASTTLPSVTLVSSLYGSLPANVDVSIAEQIQSLAVLLPIAMPHVKTAMTSITIFTAENERQAW
jgi:hypothetical protein